jgi:Spy/CpxP family protein refolding chaperone
MSLDNWSTWTTRITALAVAIALFVAGAITGAAVYRWAELDRIRDERPPPAPWEMLAPLNLTAEQSKQIREIFDRRKPELDQVLRETMPKVRQVQQSIDAEIAKLLSEPQRKQFEQMRKRPAQPPGTPPWERPRHAPPFASELGPHGPFGHPPPPFPPDPMHEPGPDPRGNPPASSGSTPPAAP